MSGRPYSLILLPTLDCNAACDYCFEEKARVSLALPDLSRLVASILDHMEAAGAEGAEVYWQGGEALLLGPAWYAAAFDLMGTAAAARGRSFAHYLQTNLVGYGPQWEQVIRTMFRGSIGTSMDFPNRYRRLRGGKPEQFTETWLRAVGGALAAGFEVGVIAVLHAGSLQASPAEFLRFFTERAGLTSIQVNLPFPGGPSRGGETLPAGALSRFLEGLLDAWMDKGFDRGVRLNPFEALLDTFSGRPGRLPCIWQPNCANEFLAVDARGDVALCDCWVTSYPRHHFGNLFATPDLSALLGGSPARRAFLDRPARLLEHGECGSCPHLSLCHGGCPVRTFSAAGTLDARDPYCEVYQAVFRKCRELAGESIRRRLARASARNIGMGNVAQHTTG